MTDTDTNSSSLAAGGPRKPDDLIEQEPNAEYFNWNADWELRACAEIERLRAENARLQELERNCWTSPEAWIAWCDIRVLERAEKAEAERDLLLDEIEALDLPVPFGPENGKAWHEAVQESLDAIRAERDTIRKINNGWAMDAAKLEEERDSWRYRAETAEESNIALRADAERFVFWFGTGLLASQTLDWYRQRIDAARKEGK